MRDPRIAMPDPHHDVNDPLDCVVAYFLTTIDMWASVTRLYGTRA